jgi:hypothetical protein
MTAEPVIPSRCVEDLIDAPAVDILWNEASMSHQDLNMLSIYDFSISATTVEDSIDLFFKAGGGYKSQIDSLGSPQYRK